ncbi:lysozyme family protein [Allocatelliglobosispora scoriae]|uniref:Lysozyme family protein n=1 Tax=Allocatelliglobosispora scoriae TaxID=643052 RepID=A0A841C3P7_9ACTN|nr:peptidoglycan DD-metalloendopeptidase family protein [Allocatelliglobosispora scoriae]MBB5873682.1 lysozyme family protein [Allocatelliglobosispora scoriae]
MQDEARPCCGDAQDDGHGTTAISRRALLWQGAAVGGGLVAGGLVLPGLAYAAPAIYNPFSAYPITGTWQDHLNAGSLGGIDFGMGVGTSLPACGAGTIQNIPYNGTGGHTVTIYHADGYRSQYMHLSQFLLANGTSVAAGSVVGRSGGARGADGSGSSTGPHLHWHMINPSGVRINPLTYVSGPGVPPPGPGTSSQGVILQEIGQAGGYTGPVDGVPGTYTWLGVQQVVRGYGYTGPIDGVPGGNTYAAMQRLAQKGGYAGPVDGALGVNSWKGLQTVLRGFGYGGPIDGVPGPNTYAALQRLAKLGGYTGPIDGALGVNSWKGVQKVLAGFGYGGPIDGAPGVNTYAALQRMAQLGGYTGPVDGIPGPNTWAALGRLI